MVKTAEERDKLLISELDKWEFLIEKHMDLRWNGYQLILKDFEEFGKLSNIQIRQALTSKYMIAGFRLSFHERSQHNDGEFISITKKDFNEKGKNT